MMAYRAPHSMMVIMIGRNTLLCVRESATARFVDHSLNASSAIWRPSTLVQLGRAILTRCDKIHH